MDGLARVNAALDRRPVDRIPRYDSFWEDTLTLWREQGMPEDTPPEELFGFDIRTMSIDASMRVEQEIVERDGPFIVYKDRAGYTVRKIIGKSRALEFLDHVTEDRDTWNRLRDGFAFDPQASARVDTASYFMHLNPYPSWEGARARYDGVRATGAYVLYSVYGPWEGTWRHRGMEPLLMDMLMDPAWVEEMATVQSDLVLACLQHCIDLDMAPDGVFLVEDLAATRGPLFSPDIWRSIFKPLYVRLADFLHAKGMRFWLHSCGDSSAYIPDLIDLGLDVLQPLQATAGMDVRDLKQEYGADLAFWGNIDVNKMSGPADACEAEIRDKLIAAKEGGGYLYHSDHSVPPEVTYGRYRWIMELVERYGAY
ncbi:MAG: hypothetical protein GY851_35770 [bacterium]|nr:hypothetical protein [bacterium]